uniref:EF-hand domain-containing protein n=1 Tax=Graphocephala atropunctata TaxID=36148 RepID=A0A1B6KZN3_9HEMI
MSCAPANLDRPSLTEVNLENLFVAMAKGGDPKADGRTISQQVAEQWLTKAQVIDKSISQADVSGAFKKTGKSAVNFAEFVKILSDLAGSKKVDLHALKEKLLKVPTP